MEPVDLQDQQPSESSSKPASLSEDDISKLTSILKSFNEKSSHCNEMTKSLSTDISAGNLPTKDGISFLEVKNHLLLQYLISLTGLIGIKLGGKSIQNHKYLKQLVELRVFLEKMKPIEAKLKYQIDKVIAMADGGPKQDTEADPLKFRANLDNLQNDDDEEEGSDQDEEESENDGDDIDLAPKASGVYRPPKIAPQYFDEEGAGAPAKVEKNVRKKTLNQTLIRELQEEFLDTPVEIHNMGDAYAKQLSREVKDRQRYEETYMTRLPMTKKDKHKAKALSTIGVLGDEITNFKQRRPGAGDKSSGKKRKLGGGSGGGKGKSKGGKRFKRK